MSRLNVVWFAAATVAVAACTDYESETDLNPSGPPMIQQVFMKETFTPAGATSPREREVFGFGTHPMATEEQQPCKNAGAGQACVTSAMLQTNFLRVIVDELLRGNSLEEINCRGNVDSDAYARVPIGATPDDIARCSVPQDVLPRTCTGEFAVCICELDGGCSVGSTVVEKGQPVGVADINQDGAVDDTRLIADAVRIQCGNIQVPLDLDTSYWNPSGNQLVPAQGGFRALGPALVLTPQRGLPASVDCELAFAEDVVDKQDTRLCAPPLGDVTAGCTPGDVSNFKFRTEAIRFNTSPANNATGVNRTAQVFFLGNTQIDPATLTGIVVTDLMTNTNLVQGTDFTVALAMMDAKNIQITWAAGVLQPNRMYSITLPTTVRDTFGQGIPAPFTITFTTAS